jgi:uncharacterized protein (DUF1778 family)
MATVFSRERPVFTIRLGTAERRLLEAAAAERHEYLAEFIRRTSLTAARRDLTAENKTDGASSSDAGAPDHRRRR